MVVFLLASRILSPMIYRYRSPVIKFELKDTIYIPDCVARQLQRWYCCVWPALGRGVKSRVGWKIPVRRFANSEEEAHNQGSAESDDELRVELVISFVENGQAVGSLTWSRIHSPCMSD